MSGISGMSGASVMATTAAMIEGRRGVCYLGIVTSAAVVVESR
jgi:hypothetical protein